ncbi:MAG: helix-turn-helix transcriptional regulator [Gammaproteobacteria bacterium]|nr:helix-turn-helix transcriptional regulator [Gammaproteobacteria bacterium]MDH5727638.1 helix-turn-helix transcriptional regulator [Gammaproteobacteria bacterium]
MDSRNLDHHLIDKIYAAGVGEIPWQDVVTVINESFCSTAGGFFMQDDEDNGSGDILMTGFPDDCMDVYHSHYNTVNPWFSIPGMMDPNCIRTDCDIDLYHKISGHFNNTEFYNDWMKPYELGHSIGGSLTTRGSLHLNFTMFRTLKVGRYRKEDIVRLQYLVTHLRRALEITSLRESSNNQDAIYLSGLDKIGIGLVLLNSQRKIIEKNSTASIILKANDGLNIKNQFITINHNRTQKIVDNLFADIVINRISPSRSISDWVYVPRISDQAAYQLMIIKSSNPLSVFGEGFVTYALLIIDPSTRRPLPRKAIQDRYGFSERETDVAQLLLQGMTAREIDRELGLRYETVRTYIKQVCHKADVGTRTQFIARVFSELSLIR